MIGGFVSIRIKYEIFWYVEDFESAIYRIFIMVVPQGVLPFRAGDKAQTASLRAFSDTPIIKLILLSLGEVHGIETILVITG